MPASAQGGSTIPRISRDLCRLLTPAIQMNPVPLCAISRTSVRPSAPKLTGKQRPTWRVRSDTCKGAEVGRRGEREEGKRWNYTIKRPGWCFEEREYYLLPIGTLQTPDSETSTPIKLPVKLFACLIPSGVGPIGRSQSTGFKTRGQSS